MLQSDTATDSNPVISLRRSFKNCFLILSECRDCLCLPLCCRTFRFIGASLSCWNANLSVAREVQTAASPENPNHGRTSPLNGDRQQMFAAWSILLFQVVYKLPSRDWTSSVFSNFSCIFISRADEQADFASTDFQLSKTADLIGLIRFERSQAHLRAE
jgi:hypothetical protein